MNRLTFLLLPGLWLAAASAMAEERPPVPAQARFDSELAALRAAPDDYDYRALWQAFAARGDGESALAALGVLDQFEDPHAPTPEECEAHASGLDEALALAPISLSAHLAAGACSADEAGARVHASAIRGLMRALERPLVGRVPQQPWRVYTRRDGEALLYALGMEMRNRTMIPGDTLDALPQVYLVRREGADRNELVYVDFFDLGARLSERAGLDMNPLYRFQLLDAYVASGINEGDTLDVGTRVAEALTDLEAGKLSADQAHTAVLEVREHDRSAVGIWWATRCLVRADTPGCPADDVDLLLDDAEAENPHALIALSLMHALGRGVAQDAERAEGLYRRLREVLDPDQATLLVAGTLMQMSRQQVAPPPALAAALVADLDALRKTLAAASSALAGFAALGVPEARALGSLDTLMEESYAAGFGPAGYLMAANWARRPATRGKAIERLRAIDRDWSLPPVQMLLGGLLISEGQMRQAAPLLERAARAGLPAAMRGYAFAYLEGGKAERVDMGRALLYVAWHMGDTHALPRLVDTYDGELPEDRSQLDEALAALEAAAQDGKDPQLALSWGGALIRGLTGKPRLREGLRQVRSAQRAGLAAAFLYEYDLALDGELSGVDADERRELLDDALAAGPDPVMRAQAGRKLYLDPDSEAAEHTRALGQMEQAEDEGAPSVLNDLAWQLCVDGEGELGLPLAQRASERREVASVVDTLAACEAVSGDHERAVRTQQRALELAKADKDYPEETLGGMRKRLAAYQEGRTDFD